jgi:hypothetical protein
MRLLLQRIKHQSHTTSSIIFELKRTSKKRRVSYQPSQKKEAMIPQMIARTMMMVSVVRSIYPKS